MADSILPSLDAIQARADRYLLTDPDTGEVWPINDSAADVPVLVAAIRDVLALHREGDEALGYDEEGVLDYVPACVECGHAMPCPTIRAVTAHIDTTPKENDRD